MAPRRRRDCTACQQQPSKYTCASCRADYCSVACYGQHKETCRAPSTGTLDVGHADVPRVDITGARPSACRTLAPAESAPAPALDKKHDDDREEEEEEEEEEEKVIGSEPLQDPAPLRPLTSLKWPYVPDVSAYPDPLTRDDPKLLQMHQYEGLATSPAIRAVLGSNPGLCEVLTSINALRGAEREEALQRALGVDSRMLKNDDAGKPLDEDTKAFRIFAEAVEAAVRGGREDVLGLDWD